MLSEDEKREIFGPAFSWFACVLGEPLDRESPGRNMELAREIIGNIGKSRKRQLNAGQPGPSSRCATKRNSAGWKTVPAESSQMKGRRCACGAVFLSAQFPPYMYEVDSYNHFPLI